MKKLPLIVGFGGVNPAGRVSNHHAYRRTVIDSLPEPVVNSTFESLHRLMGLSGDLDYERNRRFLLNHTLVREIEYFDKDAVPIHKRSTIAPTQDSAFRVVIPTRQFPAHPPDNWHVLEQTKTSTIVEITSRSTVLFPDFKRAGVTSAGQLPTGFNPGALYPSRNHPKGLQLTVVGASDALHSIGIQWDTIRDQIRPDEVAVFAGSAMGQCDENSLAGVLQAPYLGKRPTSKQAALGLAEMPADFVNAYVIGSVGGTAGVIGACATFLYNVKQGIDAIVHGGKRVVFAGGAEAPITPELMECYRIMGALASDEALMAIDRSSSPNHRRACRPFSTNAGFTLAEAAVYIVLMEESLALKLGAQVYGSTPDVFINADGFKKSIPGPGVGNYLTVSKALALGRAIVGDEAIQRRSFIHAHGTGTPQNRVTESHILNELAKTFGIQAWPVAAVKAYLGHTLAAASGDQMTSVLGTWCDGIIPGISTIDHIAEDVFHSNLHISSNDIELDSPQSMEVAFVNSKGFGGNNATAVMLSPQNTIAMLEKRHGKATLAAYRTRNSDVTKAIEKSDQEISRKGMKAVYRFGDGVLEGDDLSIEIDKISIPGWKHPIELLSLNPYEDMC